MPIQQYLPSKQFSKKILIVLGIILLVVLVKYADWTGLKNTFTRKGEIQNATLKEAVFIDTDNDGVADWEESLWGTDPKKVASFNGVDDLTYISKKRDALAINSDNTSTETDKIAQEFFSSLMVLKDSGALNDQSASVLAIALADKITSDDTLPDAISKDKTVTIVATKQNKVAYIKAVESLISTYEKAGAGSEISILTYIINNEDRTGAKDLDDASNAYIALGGALAKIKVPADIAESHRRFANSSIKVGIALKKMSLLYDNATIALPGIIQYKKYSDEFTELGTQLLSSSVTN